MRIFSKTEIMKMVRHVYARGNDKFDNRLLHPSREWGIGLFIFILILLGGSVVGAQSFNQFRQLDTNVGESDATIPRYKESLVNEVLETYQARQANYERLAASAPVLVVPAATTSSSTASVIDLESTATPTATSSEPAQAESVSETVNDVDVVEADNQVELVE